MGLAYGSGHGRLHRQPGRSADRAARPGPPLLGEPGEQLHDTNILINTACPGYTATDLNAFRGYRTPEQGAAIAIRLATLPDDGLTGGFVDDAGVVPW